MAIIITLQITPNDVLYMNEKSARRALAVARRSQKTFAPPQTRFTGAQDIQNLISWRWSLPLPELQTQFGEDRCTQFRVIVVIDPQTHKQTHRQDRLR